MDSENPTLTNVSEPVESEAPVKPAPRKRGRPAKKKATTEKKVADPAQETEKPKAADKQLNLLYSTDQDDDLPYAAEEPVEVKKEKAPATRRPRATSAKKTAVVKEKSPTEEPAEIEKQPEPEIRPEAHLTRAEAVAEEPSEPVQAEEQKPFREKPERREGRAEGYFRPDNRSENGDRQQRNHQGQDKPSGHHQDRQGGHHAQQPRNPQPHQGGGGRSQFNPNHSHQQGGGKHKNKKKGGKPHFQNPRKGRYGMRQEAESWTDPEVPEQALKLDLPALQELSDQLNRNEVLELGEIYTLDLQELSRRAHEAGVAGQGGLNRRRLLREWVKLAGEQGKGIRDQGLLEVTEEGHGFLVYSHKNYRLSEESTLVPELLIRKYALQTGHFLQGWITPPSETSTCGFLFELETVNDQAPEAVAELTPFEELTPYYPTSRILLEMSECPPPWDSIAKRTIDLLTPIGLGQRGLIVAPPRTGKTVLLQNIAHSIRKNQPNAHLIILLVDERPEEVTDFRRQVQGAEIISSTFDENAESHVHAAEMVIEKSRRMVEFGKHVIILLDSITRLARAYNTVMPSSGKILSGGVEANALQRPKRFFGSARNIEGGGSLTILGTALVETGSRMDEVIFEEFKGTGNMELQLDRALADKRIFPAISFERSGTRKEELLYHPEEMAKIYSLRRAMKGVPSNEAMEMLIQRVKKTKTNAEFLMTINR